MFDANTLKFIEVYKLLGIRQRLCQGCNFRNRQTTRFQISRQYLLFEITVGRYLVQNYDCVQCVGFECLRFLYGIKSEIRSRRKTTTETAKPKMAVELKVLEWKP